MDVKLVVSMYNVGLSFSHGVQYISAALSMHGIKHSIFIIEDSNIPLEDIVKQILEGSPQVIAFSCTSFEFDFVDKIAKEIRNQSQACLVLGGIHAITVPESLESSGFDYYCICEGELVFPRFCLYVKKYKQPPGLMTGFLNRYRSMPMGLTCEAFVPENLDGELPNYARGLLPLQRILDEKKGWLSTIVSRGCPYKCAFCINPILKSSFCGYKYCRRMSPDRAINHLLGLIQNLEGVKIINFDDDNLLTNSEWMIKFLHLYSKKIYGPFHIGFIVNSRPNHLDEILVRSLVSSGCYELQISVETGNEDARNKILGKGFSNNVLKGAFGTCNRQGLRTLAYVMHGIPFTNSHHCKETVELILRLNPVLVRDTYCFPFEGSGLRKLCDEKGVRIKVPDNGYFNEPSIEGHDGEKEKFRELVSGQYKTCERNTNYLERKE